MQNKRIAYLVGLALCTACGSPPAPETSEPVLTGTYRLYIEPGYTNPECKIDIPDNQALWLDVQFNTEGQLQSPFPGVNCRVEYPLYISCFGHGATLRAWKNFTRADTIYGRGEMMGDLLGCVEVLFDFILKKQ